MIPFLKSLRAASRGLVRNPYFTLVVVVTLGLGIGFNVAVFSIVDAVLLRPLPYENPEHLVQIWGSTPAKNVPFHNVMVSDVLEWRQRSKTIVHITAGRPTGVTFQPGGEGTDELPEHLYAWQVDSEYFPMLGVRFLIGRGFTPDEDQPGADPVVVLSHGFWKARLREDPRILQRTVRLNGKRYAVVGVLPENFEFVGRRAELFVPLAASKVPGPDANAFSVSVFGRLKAESTVEAAQNEFSALGRQMKQVNPATLGSEPRIWRLRDFVVRDIKPYLIMLSIAALLVLAIACVNVANLILVRANGRRQETALRTTLGAGRFHLVCQGMAESMVLSLLGGAAGLAVAALLVKWYVNITPDTFALARGTAIDGSSLAYSLLMVFVTGLSCGAFPAIMATRPQGLALALREGDRGAVQDSAHNRFRSVLVTSEIALSLLLLIGAGMLVKSLQRLNQQGPGFDPAGVLTARLTPPDVYSLAERRHFYDEVLRHLQQNSQVESAALSSILPLTASNNGTGFIVEGRPFPSPGDAPIAWFRTISEDYFHVMRIPLRDGRLLTSADNAEAPPVALVNETLARRFWPGESAVGKRFTTSVPRDRPVTWITIVGVVGDVRHSGIHREPDAELFWSYRQPPIGSVAILARSRGNAEALAPVVREATAAANRSVPAAQIRTLQSIVDDSLAVRRISVWVTGLFAAVALLLAGLGVFGMVSYSVSRRRREVGVRLAMGAEPGDVVALIVTQTTRLATVGLGAGLVLALLGAELLRSFLFAVDPRDPAIIALAVATLLAMSAFAAWLPARVASQLDPMQVLRCE